MSACLALLSWPAPNPTKPWVRGNLQRKVLCWPSVTAKLWDVAQISLTKSCGLLWGFLGLDKVTVRSAIPCFVLQFFFLFFFRWLCRKPPQPPLFCPVVFCCQVGSGMRKACGCSLLFTLCIFFHCLAEWKVCISSFYVCGTPWLHPQSFSSIFTV